MVSRIQELSTSVRSKLRSGITITSVSQCVEELVLNAVDSGATNIAVRVDLGIYRVQVVDNGYGISEQDMKIIGSRYATSKCGNLEDLKSNLTKYGFRGEALASIIQVSGIVDISSRYKKSSKTYEKLFTYGKGKSPTLSKHSRPSCGTTITIQDFMYNMPVRRKLIKEAIDIENIKSQIERIILISHNVSINLKNDRNNCIILQIQKSNSPLDIFLQIFGNEHEKNMAEVYHSVDQFEITGYISTQPHQTKNLQFVYINKRSVLHTKIHALLNDLLSRSSIIRSKFLPNSITSGPGKIPSSPPKGLRFHPIYILNVLCPRNEYDVCLEPKKTLVEFRDWDKLLLCVEELILKFIKEENLTISLDDRFRRSEKQISPADFPILVPHSSQTVLQVFSNQKGKGSLEDQHHSNANERKMAISDVKYAVYGRPARRNSRFNIDTMCYENKEEYNNDVRRCSPGKDKQNSDIRDVEYNSSAKLQQEDKDLFSKMKNDNDLKVNNNNKNDKQQSSLEALKQVIETVNQTNCNKVVCQSGDNNVTVKAKLSSLQELRHSHQDMDPEDFITPVTKFIPSISPPRRDDENADETMDIYDNRRHLLTHKTKSSSRIKTRTLSHTLGKNFKETDKKKKMLKSLHSFKFDKSIRDKTVEEVIPRTKLLNKNIKKSADKKPDRLYKADQSFHVNPKSSPTKDDENKKSFFNFDKTEDFSLDSINVEDLLQDDNTFYNFENKFTKPDLPPRKISNILSSINRERKSRNAPTDMEEDSCCIDKSNLDYEGTCHSDLVMESESTEIPRHIPGKILSEKSNAINFQQKTSDKNERMNTKLPTTQPFSFNGKDQNIHQESRIRNTSCISSILETGTTQPFALVNESDCNQTSMTSFLPFNGSVKTNTQTFNVTRNLFSDTDVTTNTQNFDVTQGLTSEADITTTTATTQAFNLTKNSETKSLLTQGTQNLTDNLNEDICVRHISSSGNDINDPEIPPPNKNSILPMDCHDVQMLDILPEPLDQCQIESVQIESQSGSLNMDIAVRNSEESTVDSLSSGTRKNMIDFISSDKSLSSTISRHSISESIKKYSESSQLRFEGKILHIGPKARLDKNDVKSSNISAGSSNDVAEKSSGVTSNISQPTAEAFPETLSTIINSLPTEAVSKSTLNTTTISQPTVTTSSTNSWKRVINDGGESIYINVRTGNTSFVAPPPDPVPKWKSSHSMGCPTLKIPVTDEVDPLGLTRSTTIDNCFSLSHGFDAFLPAKRKQPPEKTVDTNVKRISSEHFNNLQSSVQDNPSSSKDQGIVNCLQANKEESKEMKSCSDTSNVTQNCISSKTDEALNDFLKENFLMDDELSKWGHAKLEDYPTDDDTENLNDLPNFWENAENFAMDAEILGSDMEGRNQSRADSNVKCYNIVHPYKFTSEMLKCCKIFGQVDNKFIAIALPFKNNSPHLIVLVDQHAADERVQLEKVLLQSYEVKITLNGIRKKVLRSERIKAPIEASFQADQVRLMKSFRDSFFEIGLEFTQVNDTSVLFHCIPYCLVAKEPNEKNTRRCQTAALIIEATVVEMCDNIRTLGGAARMEDEDGARPLPRALSHVMNTIACRSAIKFGDELSLSDCERLICLLIECKLPFQCAHGRPSLIPIVDLNYLKLKNRTSKPNLKKLLHSDR